MTSKATIKIPRELYNTLSAMIADSGFSSVTEFVVFVMRSLAMTDNFKEKEHLNAEEIDSIRRQLRRLGYLKD